MAADKLVELIFRARGAKQTSTEVKSLGRDLSNAGAKAQVAGRAAARGMDQAEKATNKSRKGVRRYNKEIDAQIDSIADLRYRIKQLTEARDQFADPKVIQRYNRRIDELSDKMRGLQSAQPGGKQSTLGGFAGRLALGAGAAMAFQRGLSRAIDKGTEFESKLADLEAITGISGNRLDQLGDKSIQLSKEYGSAASDIVEANKLVASVLAEKIDFGTEEGFQELQRVAEDAVILQKAAGIDLAEAVNATTSAINQFNRKASDSREIIDTLAAGSKYGAAEVPMITRAMVNAGAAAESAGQSIQTTNAAIQVLAANGQVGERAGTALRAIFTRLQTRSKELAEFGIKEVDIKANGLTDTLRQLQPIVEDTTALQKIFGDEAINQAQILINNADAVESLTAKVSESGIANEQAAVRMNTFEEANNRLVQAIDGGLIPAFTETAGLTVKLVNGTTSLINQFSGGIRQINVWLDAHSELRREMNLQEASTRSQIDAMTVLREELAAYKQEAGLTKAEEEELRLAFDGTTEAVRNRASALFDETHALKQQAQQYEEDLERLQNNPAPAIFSDGDDPIARVKEELEGLYMEIESNEKLLEEQTKFLQEGSDGFEDYFNQVQRKSLINQLTSEMVALNISTATQQEILSGLREDLDNGVDGMQALAAAIREAESASSGSNEATGLSGQISKLKTDYQELINQPDLDEAGLFKGIELANRIQELEELLEKRQELIDSATLKGDTKDPQVNQDQLNIGSTIQEDAMDMLEGVHDKEREGHEERQQMYDEEKAQRIANEQEIAEARKAGIDQYVEAVSSATSNIIGLFSGQHQRRIDQLEQEKEQRLENINAEFAQENLSEQQRAQLIRRRQRIEQEYQKKIDAQKRKQFALDKAANISRAVMQGALSTIQALSKGPIYAAIVGAAAAAQIATIAAQKNPYEKGGWIGGRRHKDGGTMIEAEKDEFVTNRRSAMAAPRALEYMNSDPAAARRVESLFDRYVGTSPAKAESGGWINANRPINVQTSGIDPVVLTNAIIAGMEGVVVDGKIGVSEVDESLEDYRKYKSRVGNG